MSRSKGLDSSLQLKVLGAIVEFMSRSGLSNAAIREAFDACLEGLDGNGPRASKMPVRDGKYVGNGNVSAELIRVWTRDGRYLDKDARPKPLALSKGSNSLISTIKRLDPSVDPIASVESMRAVGLIKKLANGKYLPTAESVTIDRLHPLAIEHVAKSLIRLVTTVCRNTDKLRQALPLIERYAYVPDLNEAEARAFAEFSRSQGMAYLESVDDWLEQRRVGRVAQNKNVSNRSGITAGVHLVAYLGDEKITQAPVKSIGRTKKRSTPAREAHA